MEFSPGFPETLRDIFILGMRDTGEKDMDAELEAIFSFTIKE
jgi:hypothetical protein